MSNAKRVPTPDERYYWPDGKVKWCDPEDVGHLIAQLQTIDPSTKVSAVMFIERDGRKKARARGVSMSYERWDDKGWLDFQLPTPKCLAIWAHDKEDADGLSPDALEAQRDQLRQAREIIDALNRLQHLSSGSVIIARLDPILEKAAAFKRANPAPAATKEHHGK